MLGACTDVSARCSSQESHDPVPASTRGVIAPCALWGPPAPLQISECIVSGVGWDLGWGGTEDKSIKSCPAPGSLERGKVSADLFALASLLPGDYPSALAWPLPLFSNIHLLKLLVGVAWRKSVRNYVLQAGPLSLLSEGSSHTLSGVEVPFHLSWGLPVSLQWHLGSRCGNLDPVLCQCRKSSYQAGQPPASGNWGPPGAALKLSAHLALEPTNGNDSHGGFVNFLVLFSSMYKCICHVSIFVLK